MEPTDIRPPILTEQKSTTLSHLKSKGVEVAKRIVPEQTCKWLLGAARQLQRGEGKKALETLSQQPDATLYKAENGSHQKVSSSATAEPTQSEAISEQRLTQYSKERKTLGLREEKTLQEIAKEKDKQRREATDSFLDDKKSKKQTDQTEEILTYNNVLEEGTKKSQALLDVLSAKEKKEITVRRRKALAIMTVKGVKNPERVLQILEAESANSSQVRLEFITKGDDDYWWSKQEKQQAIDGFHSIYDLARKSEFINKCRQLGNVSTACDRLHQIGAKVSLKNITQNDQEQVFSIAQKLAQIPNEQLSTMLEDLRQYNFLFPEMHSYSSTEDHLVFKPLVDFMSSNIQITPEQRQILDIAHRIYQIGTAQEVNYGYGKTGEFHPLLSKHDPLAIFSSRERLVDELIVLEQLTLELYDSRGDSDKLGPHWKQKDLYKNNSFVSGQIEELAKTGDLHTLAELIRNGFTFGENHARTLTSTWQIHEGDLKTVQEDIRRSANLLTQFNDQALLSEVLLLEDLRQTKYPRYEALSIGSSRFFELLVKERSLNQEAFQIAMNLVNKLTDDPVKKTELLNDFLQFDGNLGISINASQILYRLKSPDIFDKLSPEDQPFWRQILDQEGNFQLLTSNDLLPIFFIKNQSRYKEFFQEGRLTDVFFDEFRSYMSKIPDAYYTDHQLNKKIVSVNINSFLLNPKQAPPLLSGMAEAFTAIADSKAEMYKILGMDYDKWSSFMTDGKPNITLISLVLESPIAIGTYSRIPIAKNLLTADIIDKLPENQRDFWNVWKKIADFSNEIPFFLYKNSKSFVDFYQNKSLTPAFLEAYYKDILQTDPKLSTYSPIDINALITRGILAINEFPRADYYIWSAILHVDKPSIQFAVNHIGDLKSYFNEKGETNSQLLIYLAKAGIVDLQTTFLDEKTLLSFSKIEQEFWRAWLDLPESGKVIFNQKITANPEIIEVLINEIKVFNTLFEEIKQSSSQELQKIKDQLIPLLLQSSQPEQALNKIRALFERNNLPDFGKKFRIFEILYCTPEIDGRSRFDRKMHEEGAKLSPVLTNSSRLRRLDTIYKDLLRINIDSGDVSLKNYLVAIQEGQTLLDKVEVQGISSLSPAEIHLMSRFLNRLNVLYENSLLRRQNIKSSTPLPESLDLQARIDSLKQDLQVKEGQKVIDRVSEMFVKPLGYESIDAVLSHMDKIKQQANDRNLSNPRVQEGQLEINAGDLLKGVQDDVLGYILQGGSVAREYIGVNADSDGTPFDTDTGMVLQEDLEGGLPHIIDSSPAKGYGNIIIVVRNRGQFTRTDQQKDVNSKYDSQHYELFYSGVYEKHYGIRTGFPSTEVDAVILTQALLGEDQTTALKKAGIFFNIANNGFYIPVVNPEGKVIFTEADYNRYRLNQQLIATNLTSEEFKANEFIDLLKSSPYLKILYEMDSGVSEGYSTEKHTSMVMNQFEKYFSGDFTSTFLTREDFRLMLSLHDIGKPVAVHATGSTTAQHEYTKKVLTYALQATGIQPNKVDAISSLVDQDILGEYFKGQNDAKNSAHQINELAETVGVSPKDLVEILKMFYICDAGSYTADAGGQASLDSLFVFKHEEGNNDVTFSEENEAKYQELHHLIS